MNIPRNVLFLDAAGGRNGAAAALMLGNMSGGAMRAFTADPSSWDAFADGTRPLDIVVTVSDSVVGEVCAVFWAGRPITTHWPLPDDPSVAQTVLADRIAAFVALPFSEITPLELQARLDAIGRIPNGR